MDLSNRKKALVIVNPCAGRRKLKPQLLDIANLFTRGGLETTLYTTTCKGDAIRMASTLGGRYDLVVCRGGDGTFSEVVNGLMQVENRPPVGYIPAGTTNDFAKTLGIPVNTQKCIKTILRNQALRNDVGKFNDVYFTYSASFGAFVECSYATPQSLKNVMGHAAYMYEAAKSVKKIRPIHAKVKCEQYEDEGDFVFGTVSNSYSLGGVVKLDPHTVGLNDGEFEVMLIKNPDDGKGWVEAISSVITKNYNEKYIKFIRTDHIEFEFDEEDIPPWTTDGEFAGESQKVVIDNIQNAIRIFR